MSQDIGYKMINKDEESTKSVDYKINYIFKRTRIKDYKSKIQHNVKN